MPVFNGEKYLAEQIESIILQTNKDWVLKIRNDGSSDNSQSIIDKYCQKYPDKIFCISGNKNNMGLVESLNFLMSTVTNEYIMFADQDDIWLNDKIEKTLQEFLCLENKYPKLPLLVCTDSTCIDNDKNIIYKSFFKFNNFPNNIIGNCTKMLALNVVQGCTIMINKKALGYINPMPKSIRVHDMWIPVIIAYYGKVSYLHRQTLLYRQHSNNTLGIKKIDFKYYIERTKRANSTLKSRLQLFRILPFKVNVWLWIYYKIYYAILRLL